MTIKQQGGVFGRNPTLSTLTLDGGNGFGVGDLNVAGFSNFNGRVTVTDDHLRVVRSANTSRLEVGVDATSAYLKTAYSSGGTRDLRFLSINTEIARITANGLTFNGDTAAANALDDYEEGTWTPAVGTSVDEVGTWDTSFDATYVKVGRLVTCNMVIVGTGMGFSTTTGRRQYTGLPFQPMDNGAGVYGASSLGQGGGVTIFSSGSSLYLARPYDTGTASQIYASFSYQTNA